MVAPDGTTILTAGQGRPLILTTLDPEEAMRVLGSAHRHSILVGSLLMLVASLIDRERLLLAYSTAIERGYRFYSYGDAMLLL